MLSQVDILLTVAAEESGSATILPVLRELWRLMATRHWS